MFTVEREGLGATALRAVLADIVCPLLFSRLTEPWHTVLIGIEPDLKKSVGWQVQEHSGWH